MTVPTQGVKEAREWEALVPGSAAKVYAEWSAQLTHRRRVETANTALNFFGPVLGAVVVLVSLLMGVWLIYHGHSTAGAFIATVDLVGFFLVLLFLLRGLQGRSTG